MYQPRYRCSVNFAGFMLLEFMIAISLSMLLLSLLLGMYVASQRSTKLMAALGHIRYQANMTGFYLHKDIGNAGYIGCARLNKDFSVIPFAIYSLRSNNKIQIKGENDVVIQRTSLLQAVLIQPMANRKTLIVSNDVHFVKGDIVIVSDCSKAEIMQIEKLYVTKNWQRIEASHDLQFLFSEQAQLGKLEINHYYTVKTGQGMSLYLEDIKGVKIKIMDNLINMQMIFTVFANEHYADLNWLQVGNNMDIRGVALQFQLYSGPITKTWYDYIRLK